jgi:hypothetical protein
MYVSVASVVMLTIYAHASLQHAPQQQHVPAQRQGQQQMTQQQGQQQMSQQQHQQQQQQVSHVRRTLTRRPSLEEWVVDGVWHGVSTDTWAVVYVEFCVEQQQQQQQQQGQMSQHAAAAAVAAAAAAAQQQFAGQMQHGYPQVPQGLVH